MPADYVSIIRVGLADLEFLRHERKGLSRLPSLQAKTARFGAPISIKRARKDPVPATMADLETQIKKLSVAIAGLESQRKSLGDAVVDPAIAALREQLTQLESARGDRAETDERKLVTIVFADVSGFTALSERLDGAVIFLHHQHQPVEAGIDYLTNFFGISTWPAPTFYDDVSGDQTRRCVHGRREWLSSITREKRGREDRRSEMLRALPVAC